MRCVCVWRMCVVCAIYMCDVCVVCVVSARVAYVCGVCVWCVCVCVRSVCVVCSVSVVCVSVCVGGVCEEGVCGGAVCVGGVCGVLVSLESCGGCFSALSQLLAGVLAALPGAEGRASLRHWAATEDSDGGGMSSWASRFLRATGATPGLGTGSLCGASRCTGPEKYTEAGSQGWPWPMGKSGGAATAQQVGSGRQGHC